MTGDGIDTSEFGRLSNYEKQLFPVPAAEECAGKGCLAGYSSCVTCRVTKNFNGPKKLLN